MEKCGADVVHFFFFFFFGFLFGEVGRCLTVRSGINERDLSVNGLSLN